MSRYYTLLLSLVIPINSVIAEPLLIDPTRPAGYKTAVENKKVVKSAQPEPAKWELKTTLIDPYQKIAVINDKQLKVGEIINGAELLEIGHHHVKLRYQGEFIILDITHSTFIGQIKAK
jgi:hypothetical protein